MKITSIEHQKRNKNRVNVYCDGEYTFSITKNGVSDFFLYKDKDITQADIDEIVKKDSINKGLAYACDYLLNKTTNEVKIKLKEKGYEEVYINIIIERLKDYGYLNDEKYIENYVINKAIPNNWGKQKIKTNLYKKGLDIKLIDDVLNNIEELNDNKEQIKALIKKKLRTLINEKDDRKKKEKITRFLISKGYNWNEFSDVLNSIIKGEDDYY